MGGRPGEAGGSWPHPCPGLTLPPTRHPPTLAPHCPLTQLLPALLPLVISSQKEKKTLSWGCQQPAKPPTRGLRAKKPLWGLGSAWPPSWSFLSCCVWQCVPSPRPTALLPFCLPRGCPLSPKVCGVPL